MSREEPDKVAEAYREPRTNVGAKALGSSQPDQPGAELESFPEAPRTNTSIVITPDTLVAGVVTVLFPKTSALLDFLRR